jgi:hypothetical protein
MLEAYPCCAKKAATCSRREEGGNLLYLYIHMLEAYPQILGEIYKNSF